MRKSEAVLRAAGVGAAAALLAGALARRGRPLPAALVAAGAAAFARGAFSPGTPVFGPVLRHGPRDRPAMALTFDDGPGPATEAVLDALAAAGARATFFVLGRQARRHPEAVARMRDEGHQVASHGYDHGILVFRGAAHVDDQLRRTEEAVAEAAGEGVLTRLFRTPHGFRGPATWAVARRRGYRLAGWTAGVFDSADPGVDAIVRRSAAAAGPGTVLLLHDADGWDPGRVRAQTAAAVPAICREARDRGLELVTLDDLVGAA
jgi:peptidoglycan/xylan/chitin deacetylase (PgdA/CDA1 family)